ncbi:MAG: ABC transporter permease subunit [Bauldia sp.]
MTVGVVHWLESIKIDEQHGRRFVSLQGAGDSLRTSVMQETQLINTRQGMIVLYAALQIPFAVFLIYGFIESIPRELDEAATMDGCGPLRLFFSIILPLLTPVLVTAAILNFLFVWSDFIFPLYYLNSSSNWP